MGDNCDDALIRPTLDSAAGADATLKAVDAARHNGAYHSAWISASSLTAWASLWDGVAQTCSDGALDVLGRACFGQAFWIDEVEAYSQMRGAMRKAIAVVPRA
jgi:hypothetical protein